MPHVVIVNPSPRPTKRVPRKGKAAPKRKGSTVAKKQRTAAQKAATKRMIAANRAKRKGGAPKRRVSRAKPAARAAAAPRRSAPRRKGRSRPVTSAVVATRAGRQLRYRRPNPTGIGDFVQRTLMPAAVGGGGALLLDVALGLLPLPPAMKSGPFAPLVKVAGAVGIGYAAGMVVSRRTAEQIAAGALTVQMYNFAKAMLVKVSGGKIPGLSEYVSMYPDGVGAYVSGDEMPALAYTDSGQQVGEYVEGYETGVYR